jgi:glucose/arabinose dehydrogenase
MAIRPSLLLSRLIRSLGLFALVSATACGDDTTAPVDTSPRLDVSLIASGFASPVQVVAPAGDRRVFVVERAGTVKIVKDGVVSPLPFLDLTGVVSTFGSERGMLSLVFHPQFATNRQFFVNYAETDGSIRIARFTASAANPDVADVGSRKNIRRIPHTGVQHYGGMMQFMPDGTLLISVGDAGSGNTSGGDSQQPGTLRGKLIRIDVNGGDPFAIPTSNPFVGETNFRPEIYALGLRNPWRFWIDAPTQQIFLTDVGEASYEELNVVPLTTLPGANFGWSFIEGPLCLPTSGAAACNLDRLFEPTVTYQHGPGCNSITGGVVYRGTQFAEHSGRYFYADFCQGWLKSLRANGGMTMEPIEWKTSIPVQRLTSFGVDGFGEVYAVSYAGELFKLGRGSR